MFPVLFSLLYAAKGYSPDGKEFKVLSPLWWSKILTGKLPVSIYTGLILWIDRPDMHWGFALYSGVATYIIWFLFQKRVFLSALNGGKWQGIDENRFILRKVVSRFGEKWRVQVYGALVGCMYVFCLAPYLNEFGALLLLKGFVWKWCKTDNASSLIYGGFMGLSVMVGA